MKKIKILFFILCILMLFGCTKKVENKVEEVVQPTANIIDNFEIKKNKVTFVNYWATWCQPCVSEMDDLEELYNEMKNNENVEMIFVNLGEDRTAVEKFALDKNYTMPIYCDVGGKLGEENKITAIPQTYIYNKNQIPVDRYIGANAKDVYKNAIEAVLNK